ncbi:hypothetical protein Tco_1137191, partial [Tanacetum coccineum]
ASEINGTALNEGYVTPETQVHRRISISEEALGAFGKSQTYRQNITCWNYNQKGYFYNQCSKLVASKDKEVNQAARDSDNALVCCVENTICKEELERFKLRSGKVRLADDKTLDICRLPRRLQRPAVEATKGSLVVARGNKCGSLYMVERLGDMSMLASKCNVPDVRKVDIYFCKPCGLGKQKNLSFTMSVKIRKLQRLQQELRVAYSRGGMAREGYKSHTLEAFGIRRVTRLSEAEILHLWTRFMEPGGSSDTSKGSENSESFKDSGRSDEEYSKDGASSKKGGSETPQVRRSTRESMAPVRYSLSANYLLLTENGEPDTYFRSLE